MTRESNNMKQLAYSVIYTAMRGGATQKHVSFYRCDEQIYEANQFAQMISDISRQAVANGQANSVDDVVIESVSLLNPMHAIDTKVFTQQRDTAPRTNAEEAFLSFHCAVEEILQSYEHREDKAMEMLDLVKQEVMTHAQLASDLNGVVESREYDSLPYTDTE